LGHAESEDQLMRTIDLQVLTDMAHLTHFGATLREVEAAADARIDPCRQLPRKSLFLLEIKGCSSRNLSTAWSV
jgi:hypothetical protein